MKFDRIIYKTTNIINGKIYIGQDSYNCPDYLGSGKILKLALEKYGKENFKKEILAKCETIEETDRLEIYFICKFDSTNESIGYNILKGGKGNGYESYIWKMKESLKGENNPMYGKSVKEIWIEKYGLEEANKMWNETNKKRSKNGKGKGTKAVIQFDKDDNFIAEFESLTEASKKTGTNINSIRYVCRGERSFAGKCKWRWKS